MGDVLRPDAAEAAAEWARRVRANREQVDRFREVPDGPDFYGPVAAAFRANPHRPDEPVLNVLRSLVRPGETWLDIGAGAGRYALPIALLCGEVIALDPSDGMLGALREGMAEYGISNVRIVQSRWPSAERVEADVALIANVGNDIEGFGAFLDAMEGAARRLCVGVFLERQPTFAFDRLWPAVHGEARATLPALPEFLALLLARKRIFEVSLSERSGMSYGQRDDLMAYARRQFWTKPGSAKDLLLQRVLEESLQEREGRWALAWDPVRIGVVTWEPR
jgi:SAM-dependent methyltransferase